DSFEEKTGKKGVMISAVDLLKGIAIGAGMKVIEVPGADGTLHTNYVGKAQAAVDALTKDGYDFAYVHVEAPDEMGHQGSLPNKLEAIESLDAKVIRTVVEGMKAAGEEFRLLIMPDHPTPIRCRTHTSDPVPFLLYDSTMERRRIGFYNEEEAKASGILYPEGYKLIDTLFEK
ncbi:MAG: phosphoglycerate mutase, partial [Lachnospiraceae bacterium]|nr:phosphoglycerate mutase [Lachnospiraceae bacterium]